MPALFALLGSIFVRFHIWSVLVFSFNIAWRAALVATYIVIVGTILAAVWALINTLTATLPAGLQTGIDFFLPDSFDECVTIVITAYVLTWVWGWHNEFFKYLKNIQLHA